MARTSKLLKELLLIEDIKKECSNISGNKLTDEQLEEKFLCENSFYYFSSKAWSATRGENSFIPSYHLQVICEHMEALYKLEINRLIINCPFRVGKSTIGSVFFQPWVWTKSPELSFLYTSYKEALSVRDSVFSRRLLKSDWYQSLWGHEFQFMNDVNNKLRFENTAGGYRISSSVNGGNTGDGGHFEICFPYETLITTDQGDIPIGRIVEDKIECNVLSYNHNLGVLEYCNIEEFMRNDAPLEMIEIEMEKGVILECTSNHPIYVWTKNGCFNKKHYIPAKNLKLYDKLLTVHEGWITINSISRKKSTYPSVYNLKVRYNNNYFAMKSLVHNCDDPNSVDEAQSDVIREGTNDWHDYTMSSRFVAPFSSFRRCVMQQRTHARDLSGHLLSKNDSDWVHLMLPMEFIPAHRSITIPLRMTKGTVWRDPRTEQGQLLCPQWINEKELKKIKEEDFRGDLYRISGQLQQMPSPADGGIFKREWFCLHTENDYPTFDYVIQSWDTALVGKQSSTSPSTLCYSACTTWGVFRRANNIPCVFLISLYKGQLEYPDLRKMVVRLANNYYDTDFDEPSPPKIRHKSDIVLIESKGSGYTLASELMSAGIPIMRFDPTRFGDKKARAQRITDIIENGQMWLPTIPPHNQQPNAYAKQLIKDCLLFPKGESNDTIDSMSQALIRLKQTNWLYHPDNPTFEQPLKLERNRGVNMRRKLGF